MTKVLVVEDDESLRTTMCEILGAVGLATEGAQDGEEALARIGPDIDGLVLDLHMPKVDGLGVLEALSDGPVIVVVSAFEYRERSAVEARFRDRVCAFLRKPVPPSLLIETVMQCLGVQ